MFRILVQEITIPKRGERFSTNARVNDALEDLVNGNRLTSARSMLKCRIAEIFSKRRQEAEKFDAWARRTFRVP